MSNTNGHFQRWDSQWGGKNWCSFQSAARVDDDLKKMDCVACLRAALQSARGDMEMMQTKIDRQDKELREAHEAIDASDTIETMVRAFQRAKKRKKAAKR